MPSPAVTGSKPAGPICKFTGRSARPSDNETVITLWEALARHITIVFGRELRAEGGNPRLAEQHDRILRLIRKGALDLLDEELQKHIMRLRRINRQSKRSRAESAAKLPVFKKGMGRSVG